MRYFKTLIFILLTFIFLPTNGETPGQSIELGKKYLITKILEDKYTLGCKANVKSEACPVNDTGRLLLGYFIVDTLGADLSITARNKIITLVNAEKNHDLWGYSPQSPLDADDSSFALQILTLLHQPQAGNALTAFYKPKLRAYSTFVTNQDDPQVAVEVNANVDILLHMLRQDALINYDVLYQLQTKEGYWQSQFYAGKYYSTYITMKLLCDTQRDSRSVARGLRFITTSQNENGSWGSPGNAYDTALALNTLLTCQIKTSNSVRNGVKYLLNQQQKSGNWRTDNIIWKYLYNEKPRVLWSASDDQHVLTTTLAIKALQGYYFKANSS